MDDGFTLRGLAQVDDHTHPERDQELLPASLSASGAPERTSHGLLVSLARTLKSPSTSIASMRPSRRYMYFEPHETSLQSGYVTVC